MQIQSMPDASPIKWHLAHTSWAFETFLLTKYLPQYQVFNPQYEYLFNSYYNAIGEQFPRTLRGTLSRPGLAKIYAYREHIDQHMRQLIRLIQQNNEQNQLQLLLLLINHEQQHQELMVTDLKHGFFQNPSYPACFPKADPLTNTQPSAWIKIEAGVYTIGHKNDAFYFDNEGPRHRVFLEPFQIASRLVTNGEYLEFIESGGYLTDRFWLSEEWCKISQNKIESPLYWIKRDSTWFHYTLAGLIPLNLDEAVTHVNYFEASAYAAYRSKRLPTEQEWEIAATAHIKSKHHRLEQMFNCRWQWTSSSYSAYPGFKRVEGAIGEYNGKFMVNQYVLRGGSKRTPKGHIRASYRNFFYPSAAWQYSGIRLAKDVS